MLQNPDRAVAAPLATALRRYGVALGSVAFALALSLLGRPLIAPNPFLLFFAAVALSAWVGGLGAGLVATGLAALVSDYFLLAPTEALSLDGTNLVRLGGFTLVALFICGLSEARIRGLAALRESEKRARLLVEGTRDYAMVMLDPAGRVVSWNQGAEIIHGYRAPDIISKHISVFHLPDDVAGGIPMRALDSARTQGRFEDEGWRLRQDGAHFWANVVITALRDGQGQSAASRK